MSDCLDSQSDKDGVVVAADEEFAILPYVYSSLDRLLNYSNVLSRKLIDPLWSRVSPETKQFLEETLRAKLGISDDQDLCGTLAFKTLVRNIVLWISTLSGVNLMLQYFGVNIATMSGEKNQGTKRKRIDLEVSFDEPNPLEVKDSKRWRPDRAYVAIHEFIRKMFGSKTTGAGDGCPADGSEQIPLAEINQTPDQASESSSWHKVPNCNFVSADSPPPSFQSDLKKTPAEFGEGQKTVQGGQDTKSSKGDTKASLTLTEKNLDSVTGKTSVETKSTDGTEASKKNTSGSTPKDINESHKKKETFAGSVSAPTSPTTKQGDAVQLDQRSHSASNSPTSNKNTDQACDSKSGGSPKNSVYTNLVSPFRSMYKNLTSPKTKDGEIENEAIPEETPTKEETVASSENPSESGEERSEVTLASCEADLVKAVENDEQNN